MEYPIKILKALNEVMTAVGYVQKGSTNSFHRYNYASEGDLLAALRPAMVKAGLLLIPSASKVNEPDAHGNIIAEYSYTLAHADGDVWPEKIIAYGCGNDRSKEGKIGDKGLYKAFTGANKYLLFKLFQIETGDDPEKHDGTGNEAETQEKPQSKSPVKRFATAKLKAEAAKRILDSLDNCEIREDVDAIAKEYKADYASIQLSDKSLAEEIRLRFAAKREELPNTQEIREFENGLDSRIHNEVQGAHP